MCMAEFSRIANHIIKIPPYTHLMLLRVELSFKVPLKNPVCSTHDTPLMQGEAVFNSIWLQIGDSGRIGGLVKSLDWLIRKLMSCEMHYII